MADGRETKTAMCTTSGHWTDTPTFCSGIVDFPFYYTQTAGVPTTIHVIYIYHLTY